MSALLRWVRLPWARQALLLECAWALARAAWQVRTWPFARLSATLGRVGSPAANDQSPHAAGNTDQINAALAVRSAVRAWLRVLPLAPTCLMCAVAARRMLVRRGLPCQLYAGVRANAAGTPADPSIAAHAWLRSGPLVVTGEQEASRFQPIAVYRSEPPAPSLNNP